MQSNSNCSTQELTNHHGVYLPRSIPYDNKKKLRKKLSIVLDKLTETVNQNPKVSYTFVGEVHFKELFAYSHCLTMFNALSTALPKNIKPTGLVLTDECNNPVHYIHSVVIAGNKYFLDAFGLFEDLDDIKQRFGRCLITSINHFSPSNEQHFNYVEQQHMLSAGGFEKASRPGDAPDDSDMYFYELALHLLNLISKGN
ncbi:MAG: hypothetical protein CML20_12675 [Rheinheimera sp.]|nr:hypothetical protein [Rheinheimera sp.]|tara:strand:+ start:10672 stop:11268 length:597 start_codon:yes stop_codon:yes gene_type:complete